METFQYLTQKLVDEEKGELPSILIWICKLIKTSCMDDSFHVIVDFFNEYLL